jgi:hypothetical protein
MTVADYLDQPENRQTSITSNESSAEKQHPMTDVIRTKQQRQEQLTTTFPKKRPVATDYFDQPEDGLTTIDSNEPAVKKQRTTDGSLQQREQLIATLQKKHEPIQEEKPQTTIPEKRPTAVDYSDQEDKPTTNSNEPSTKKQRLASARIHEPVETDHIRSSNTDVYISARKSMTVRTYLHSKSKRTEAVALLESGATENFIELKYAEWLHVTITDLRCAYLLTYLMQRRPRISPIFNFYTLGTCTVQGTFSSDGKRSSQSRTSLFRLSFASLLIIRFLLASSRSVSVLGPCTVHKRCNMYCT